MARTGKTDEWQEGSDDNRDKRGGGERDAYYSRDGESQMLPVRPLASAVCKVGKYVQYIFLTGKVCFGGM